MMTMIMLLLKNADNEMITIQNDILVGGFNHLEKYEFVNGKDYPIYI